jgi:DNA-binding NarL/FixJ family response regulator
VIDINLKAGSGLDLIKVLRAESQEIRLLVVSAHDEDLFAERALRAGATGYINKQNAVDNLIESVRKVLAGEIYLSPVMQRKLSSRGKLTTTELTSQSLIGSLSDRELEVFQLIGEGSSTKQIARKLNRSPKTIDRHRENIKRKLNLSHANDLVRSATSWVLTSR